MTPDIKSIIRKELDSSKELLQIKLKRFFDKDDGKIYQRRLNRIYDLLKERCFMEGKPVKALQSADLYQKIELFMDYDKEQYNEEEVYKLIAEVFKSIYVNLLLSFIEEEEYFPMPYLGKLYIRDIEKYSEVFKKNIRKFYSVLHLDPLLRKELRKVRTGEKLEIVKTALAETEKTLKDKSE